jgi:antitoxin component YwqK of YwqJK toxin-antitoxin module
MSILHPIRLLFLIPCLLTLSGSVLAQKHKAWIYDKSAVRVYQGRCDTIFLLKDENLTDGDWTLYYDQTFKMPYGEFTLKNKTYTGISKDYYRNGKLKIFTTSQANTGKWEMKAWYPDGALSELSHCENDTCRHYEYYPSGNPKSFDLEVKKTWILQEYYCDNKTLISSSHPNEEGIGHYRSHYCNGVLHWEDYFFSGSFIGSRKIWFSNGQLRMVGQYDSVSPGKTLKQILPTHPKGLWTFFDSTGRVVYNRSFDTVHTYTQDLLPASGEEFTNLNDILGSETYIDTLASLLYKNYHPCHTCPFLIEGGGMFLTIESNGSISKIVLDKSFCKEADAELILTLKRIRVFPPFFYKGKARKVVAGVGFHFNEAEKQKE